jgi:L-cysteine:1D-myo-inositol 2-amino-2-deoxy-alpha-D-glucopyranoside ligase
MDHWGNCTTGETGVSTDWFLRRISFNVIIAEILIRKYRAVIGQSPVKYPQNEQVKTRAGSPSGDYLASEQHSRWKGEIVRLFNTLSQTSEEFTPWGEEVKLYVCGITPYDTTHLGHAFTYATADVLVRYLEYKGLRVRYVQNVTDIDDDILKKAKEVGEDWKSLGDRWTAHFIRDMQALNVRPPDHYPRATEVIPQIITAVEKLLDAGVAYQANEHVYFHIESWPEFGKLCRIPPEEMLPIANERGNKPDDPHKRDPLDFVLWQAQAVGEPAWHSPWGLGRPGWHIECSTMATHFLGQTIDIHSGGGDLCFPHHECEIAQIEPVMDGKTYVRFWLHTAMVRHDGEKMSKSLGNLVMVRDLLEKYSADALRLYMAGHHYREEWTYNEEGLIAAEILAEKARGAARCIGGEENEVDPDDYLVEFEKAMDDDLDTVNARQVLSDLCDEIITAASMGRRLESAQQGLSQMSQVFGLRLDDPNPEERVIAGWDRHLVRFIDTPG